jgi:hypothetical protein
MHLFESHETLTPTGPSALLPSPFSLLAPLPIPILAFSPHNTTRYDILCGIFGHLHKISLLYELLKETVCALSPPPVFLICCGLKPG